MTQPRQKYIERRAYKLWEDAGQPKGRDQEFYLEAERQLEKSASATNSRRPITFSRAAAQYGTKRLRAD
jgi:Protein of unknown function (DUF2934)